MSRSHGLRPASPRTILLAGPMGAGKSSVGRQLAELTGWPYLDNDAMLLASTGKAARELISEGGIGRLHDEERRILHRTLEHPGPLVASIAASAVDREEERTLLIATGSVVYLRCRLPTLLKRLGQDQAGGGTRPLLDRDPLPALSEMQERRSKLYEEVAWRVIDADYLDPRQLADQVLEVL